MKEVFFVSKGVNYISSILELVNYGKGSSIFVVIRRLVVLFVFNLRVFSLCKE